MKTVLLALSLIILIGVPAYGEPLSDRTGLVNRLNVEAGGHAFEVETVSNFYVEDHQFDLKEKRLTIFIDSSLENNLGEVIIPRTLLSGNFSFYLNDQPYYPTFKSNDKITFLTLNFTGSGDNKIDIVGTETLRGIETKVPTENISDTPTQENGGGCLIATVTYGTELAPQVQQLREIRDQKLMKTDFGKSFMNSFNDVYYSFSPSIADYERENPFFKETVKFLLTPMLYSLNIMNSVSMDNDAEVLGVGISIIVMNIGMYFALPTILIVRFKR